MRTMHCPVYRKGSLVPPAADMLLRLVGQVLAVEPQLLHHLLQLQQLRRERTRVR